MALTKSMKSKLMRMGGANLARFIGMVERTCEHRFDPPDMQETFITQHPAICACWHGQFMMLAACRPESLKFSAMVARHGDAELIGEAMRRIGVELIRGAGAGGRRKDRGGAYALKASLSTLKEGSSVVITADVPPGPARRAGEGIITLARLSGRPILPLAAATSRYHALNTWSRLTFNLPYGKLGFAMGSPIFVPRHASPEELEALRRQLEADLNETTERAYALVGADPTRATPPGARDPILAPLPVGLGLKTYRAGTRALQIAAPLVFGYRERQGKEVLARRAERFGESEIERPKGALLWLHAASVGETNAILPVIESLRARRPDLRFLLTTGTLTSARLAEDRLGDTAIHQFVPLDVPKFARDFIDHWRPDAAVFTESEIWPNLIIETAAREIPLVLINARMSKRSFQRWRRQPGVSVPLFNRFDLVLSQNARFARQFSELGARRVEVAGNLKIDAPPLPLDLRAYEELKAALNGRKSYIAASTHNLEDEIVADAHLRIAAVHEGLLSIIAPRHPERGSAIADMLKERGLAVALRSLGQLPDATTDVYVADTIGELGTLYSLSPVALIGGSLVDKGGQNPVEAIRHRAAVLTGPYRRNFVDIFEALLAKGGAQEVTAAEDLAQAVITLLGEAAALEEQRTKADDALNEMTGALETTVEALIARLPEPEVDQKELDCAS
jgi:3-deoxy-D-manno-octulosonic-acid transferase